MVMAMCPFLTCLHKRRIEAFGERAGEGANVVEGAPPRSLRAFLLDRSRCPDRDYDPESSAAALGGSARWRRYRRRDDPSSRTDHEPHSDVAGLRLRRHRRCDLEGMGLADCDSSG